MTRRTFSCSAPYGTGGTGRHLLEAIEGARAAGELAGYFAGSIRPGDERIASVVDPPRWVSWVSRYTPVRFDPAHRLFLGLDAFDRQVAARLRTAADAHFAVAGQALHTFQRARALGYRRLELLSPTAHLDHVARQHELARRQYPIERDWLNDSYRRKALNEYAMADTIHVASEYARQSFLRAGVPAARLARFSCSADRRFTPSPRHPDVPSPYQRDDRPPGRDAFHIVCTGVVSVVKGIPVLLEALAGLRQPRVRLTLVGGTGTRGMRRYLERWLARDSRIVLAPGDPLPHLHDADVYVQPSYQDGLSYGVLEALACRVPVIVTEDTGAKDVVREGENGLIVPTGNVPALRAAIDAVLDGGLTTGDRCSPA